jgi:hypothetical protein
VPYAAGGADFMLGEVGLEANIYGQLNEPQ